MELDLAQLQADLESLSPSQFAAVAKRCLLRLDDFAQAAERHLRRVRDALRAIGDSLDYRASHGRSSRHEDRKADAAVAISHFAERQIDSGLVQIAYSIKHGRDPAMSLIELLDYFPEMREPTKIDVGALRTGIDVESLGDVWQGETPNWER